MNTKESLWVDLGEFRVTAYDIAEEFAWDIRNYEQREKRIEQKDFRQDFQNLYQILIKKPQDL